MIPEAAVEAAWEQARSDADGYPYPERDEIRRILEAAAPHMLTELYVSIPCNRCGNRHEGPVVARSATIFSCVTHGYETRDKGDLVRHVDDNAGCKMRVKEGAP